MVKKNIYLQWLAILAFFLLPFNIKKYVTELTPLSVTSLEFSSFFLYASEIFAFVLFLSLFFVMREELMKIIKERWLFGIFVFLSLFSVFISDSKLLTLVGAMHICIAVMFMASVAVLVRNNIISVRDFMKAIAIGALIQVEVALLQFLIQGSIGVHYLGEELVNGFTKGIAKIDVLGMVFIRPYGTVPHPNILGGLLSIGLVAWLYLFAAPSKRHGVVYRSIALIGLFISSLGVIFSFSRSAWIASFVTYAICVVVLFCKKLFKSIASELLMFGLVMGVLILGLFGWLVVPRGVESGKSPAIQERIAYVEIARRLVWEYPFGVGMNNSISRAEQEGMYKVFGLNTQINRQPVHNIFILIMEELGILGFLVFFFSLVSIIWERRKNVFIFDYFFPILMLGGLIFIGFFDHYLITNNVGRLMFFGVLGVISGLPKTNDFLHGRHL